MKDEKIITINDLPKHSEWPERLLGIEEFNVRDKSHDEVVREYNTDKWGELLSKISMIKDPSVSNADKIVYQENEGALLPYWNGSNFVLDTEENTIKQHFDIYSNILKKYVKNASGLCELGAGYGRFILNFAKAQFNNNLDIFAGELTETGQELIKILSKNMGLDISVGFCDFRSQSFENLKLMSEMVIYTSYSVHYVPELRDDFPDFLLTAKPKMVVHFEPCFEHYDESTLHGLMCRKYIKMNDYNTNLLTILKKAEKAGRIEIIEEKKNVIGSNPFLPISIIAWRGC